MACFRSRNKLWLSLLLTAALLYNVLLLTEKLSNEVEAEDGVLLEADDVSNDVADEVVSSQGISRPHPVVPLYTLRRESSRRPALIVNSDTEFPWEEALCRWSEKPLHRSAIVMDVFMRDVQVALDRHNIYLVETGCLSTMTVRTLCALESYAANNPESVVWLLVTTDVQDDSDGLLTALHRRYTNIRYAALDLNILFRDTPLQAFYTRRILLASRYVTVQMSDLVRLAVVWLHGGFYSDCDIVCLKSVQDLKNSIAFEMKTSVANAAFHFEKRHEFPQAVMEYITDNSTTDGWTSLGPIATTATVKQFCGLQLSQLKQRRNDAPLPCRGVMTLLPERTFYPTPWEQFERLIKEKMEASIEETYPHTYGMHITGSSSIRVPADTVRDSSFLVRASQENCPLVYTESTRRNRFI